MLRRQALQQELTRAREDVSASLEALSEELRYSLDWRRWARRWPIASLLLLGAVGFGLARRLGGRAGPRAEGWGRALGRGFLNSFAGALASALIRGILSRWGSSSKSEPR
ncbi:MAG: hypothetical protein N2561_04950 [Bacteroidetes bacterium]|nr:hypothetical protein [Rhodothermia bacterium]MCS7154495.1 hypothetical protein [Bacteroidota bacterium]MCX7906868.1 hypothetical protein [Bacteroidota bacterium]MDW8136853.1 hypothetical protein [Bacteroidota bacterium]MDW8285277.1 hypothetical protein [Bacteroidota bacterium]